MSYSPRKDRTPFRPLNSLHSSQQPGFGSRDLSPAKHAQHAQHDENSHSQLDLGEIDSLLDSTDGSISLADAKFVPPPVRIPAQYSSPHKEAFKTPGRNRNMVRERDAPAALPVHAPPATPVRKPQTMDSTSPLPSQAQAQAQAQTPAQAQHQPRNAVPNSAAVRHSEFGKPSPLRNPLKKDPSHSHSNVFNPNQRRPEHHRPAPSSTAAPVFRHPRDLEQAAVAASRPAPADPFAQPRRAPSNPLYAPMQNPLYAAQRNPLHGATPQPIRMPANNKPKSIPATPRPTFNSIGPNTTFQPFNARPVPMKPIDLTNTADDDSDDAFDPDAALRQDKFGAADPYAYVDTAQTSENIKALLEGAFEEDDGEKPRLKLRKRAAKPSKQAENKKLTSLEEKLKQLDLDAAKKDEAEKTKTAAEEEEDDDDEEDGTVEGLKIKLLPHQVDGVSWMIDKESGPRKKNGVLPKGGILADDMGLGKTIQSVTLILTNPRPPLDAKPPPENPKRKMPSKDVSKGTLVVAPLALIKQWEAEIKSKVEKDHALKVLVHHGPSRTKSHAELKKYDVVVTTYQILASEHAGSSDHDDGAKVGCFGLHWYRVILDEAHSIKNRNAKSTQACYALRSWYRWCLTGTPMQNNLDELQSLICFLRIKPYNNLGTWKDQITTPMKNGKGQYAIKRIQYFLKGFMKRRTKDILKQEGALNFGGKSKDGDTKGPSMQIVKREIETVVCELHPEERSFYDKLQDRAQNRLDDMMKGEKTDYIGALVLLLRLRQACNHPQLIQGSMSKDKDALSTGQPTVGSQTPRKTSASVDDELDALTGALGGLSVESKLCDVCNVKLSPEEASTGCSMCIDCQSIAVPTSATRVKKDKHHKVKRSKQASAPAKPAPPPRARNRKIVIDSDDEEGEGSWLVDHSQQNLPDLGRAGGTDDEDAEGGGDTLGSIDSVTDDEDSLVESKNPRQDLEDSGIASTAASDSESSSSDNDDDGDDRDDDEYYNTAPLDSDMPLASTKIRKLLHILHAEAPEHKTIVFSQFTSMLDLIEPHLKRASIRYVRYDGSMRNDAREAALESLRNNKATRVLLCSLKCGSLGLNLTAASRVVIVEPFWNPFVEEQAIDRVHRLNQTVDVKVFKLTVGNTVEERIIELQEKKRELAKAAIEGGKANAKLTMRDLMSLFGRNPEDVHVGDDEDGKGKITDFSLPKVAGRGAPSSGTVSSGNAGDRQRQQVGWSNGRLSYDRNDRRGGYERKSGGSGRTRVEDPVYGRR